MTTFHTSSHQRGRQETTGRPSSSSSAIPFGSFKMSTLDELNFAYGSISTALFVLIVYHVLLYTVTFTGTFHTQLGANLRNSVNWVLKHKEKSDPASATLAVQTIRNTILVAVFVGGNAFTSAFSFANTYSPDDVVQQARSIILAALLFSSFLCWALVIRFSAHLGYLVGTLSYEPSPSSMQVNVSAPSGSVIEVVTDFPKNQDSKANDIQRGRVEGKRRYDPTKECMRIVGLCMTFFR